MYAHQLDCDPAAMAMAKYLESKIVGAGLGDIVVSSKTENVFAKFKVSTPEGAHQIWNVDLTRMGKSEKEIYSYLTTLEEEMIQWIKFGCLTTS